MKNTLLAPEIIDIIKKKDDHALQTFCTSLHPTTVAEFIGSLSGKEVWYVLSRLEPRLQAEIFGSLDPDLQEELAESLQRKDLAHIVTHMSADERVDLLKRLPEEKQENLMPILAQAEREDIRRLSSYEEGTAGSVMTSEYAVLSPEQTVQEAIAKLRLVAPDKETIYYTYVVDSNRQLIGFLSLKDLILAKPDRKIESIMHREDLIYALTGDDQEDAAQKIAKYNLIALPVVNKDNVLMGIITYDDAIDVMNQEYTEDMEKFMAISGSHESASYLRTSSWGHFKNRFIWLMALAVVGLISGYIVQMYEHVLLQFVILATFMPMLADTGGNTGSQSATLIVRALAIREITPGDIFKIIWKEFKVGLPMALLLSLMAFGRVFFLSGNADTTAGYSMTVIGVAVGTALGLQVLTSTLIGALLPIGAAKLKFDPAVVASPALTTIVDITGLLIFFTTAQFLLGI